MQHVFYIWLESLYEVVELSRWLYYVNGCYEPSLYWWIVSLLMTCESSYTELSGCLKAEIHSEENLMRIII